MAFTQTSGILGQLINNPAGGALTQLYSAPTGATADLSITVCNQSTSVAANITIVAQSGSNQSLIENQLPLAPAGYPGSSFTIRAVPLGAGQAILVKNANSNVDFTAFGYTSPSNITTF